MHQLNTPTRFRRFVSTLLSLALVASFAPSMAIAAPPAAGGEVVALAASTTSTLRERHNRRSTSLT